MGSVKGSTGHQAKDAWNMAQTGYWRQSFRAQNDPFQMQALRGFKRQAGQDWMGMGRALGNQQADIATQSLQDALAARGGGNLSSALGMGAQARVGGALQGLQMGAGLKGQALQQLIGAAQGRLGLQNQLYGMLTGVSSAQIGAGAQMAAGQSGAMGQLMSSLMGGGSAGGIGHQAGAALIPGIS